ncbi:MAG: hypothetical protein R3A44_19770 [Caldilineaceae bacterium]
MSARSQQQYSTLFDCYGEKKSEILAGLSVEDSRQIERYFWRNVYSGRALNMRKRAARRSADANHVTNFAPDANMDSPGFAESQWIVSYLKNIVHVFQREKSRLRALARGDDETWSTLAARLIHDTYRLLIAMDVPANLAQNMASAIAQTLCCQIAPDQFPCDVPFDTWLQGLVNQQILYQLSYKVESQPLYQQKQSVISDPFQMAIGTIDSAFQLPTQNANADLLAHAIGQLPSIEQRMVIVYHCYYDLGEDEIALRMNKTKDEVDALCHSALRQLQGIMRS